jgi:hypothetical protein
MKRLASITSLLLALAVTFGAAAQTQSVRESIDSDSITSIKVLGNSRVVWVHDTEPYIQVSWFTSDIEKPESYGISIKGSELTFEDHLGRFYYELHLDSSTKVSVTVDGNSRFAWPNGKKTEISSRIENTSISGVFSELKGLVDELVTTYDSVANSGNSNKAGEAFVNSPRKKRKYSIADRTNFDFHWAFTNWGDQPYNGLMKMDGPYNLRTSFSSYQLSENYAVVMTNHIKLSIGIGYESDVYKFTDNYITMDATTGAFVSQNQAGVDAVSGVAGSNLGDWSSRFVTRYVTLPLEFEYRDKGILKSFRLAVGIVPGLSFSSRHTGLKHELEQRGRNYQDAQENVSKFVNPYKLDLRLTFKRKSFGVFLQVPTLPVFVETGQKVYPIKLGFML